jgi:hypothetical protein
VAKDGCHAKLVCLSRDLSQPIVIPLKFDLSRGQAPFKGIGGKIERARWETGAPWLHIAGNMLYMGEPNILGIWTIPLAQIEAAFAAQKKTLPDQKAQANAATEQVAKTVMSKPTEQQQAESEQADAERHRNLLLLMKKKNSTNSP